MLYSEIAKAKGFPRVLTRVERVCCRMVKDGRVSAQLVVKYWDVMVRYNNYHKYQRYTGFVDDDALLNKASIQQQVEWVLDGQVRDLFREILKEVGRTL